MAGFPSFKRQNDIPLYQHVYITTYSHLFVNNAARKMRVQISLQDYDFHSFIHIPRNGTGGSNGTSNFNF